MGEDAPGPGPGRGPGGAVGGGPLAEVLVVAEAVAVGTHVARRDRPEDFAQNPSESSLSQRTK